jgi:5-methylthioribose kinase
MRLDVDSVGTYLASAGVVPKGIDLTVEVLGGGVSNGVFRIEWDNDSVVVKQPLPNLAVEADWPADIDRVHNEAEAARVYRTVVEKKEIPDITVPKVRFEDHDNHIIIIDAASSAAHTWKSALLDGDVDDEIGKQLGVFLGTTHAHTATDDHIRDVFGNDAPFEQLRIEPYHKTVAERHPDVAPRIEIEIERLRKTKKTLVHGDFSPKNVLLDDTAGGSDLWLIDFEVAHWGDPTFDVAFLLNHLFIKAVYNAHRLEAYIETAERFWHAYEGVTDYPSSFERDVICELGVLMLARMDGKSPVEYVERATTKDQIRSLAKYLLTDQVETVHGFIAELQAEIETK